MNREEYKAAIDSIPFSPDFQARTEALLRARLRETEKETSKMNFSRSKKLAVLVAAAVALLAVSVSAVLFLTPRRRGGAAGGRAPGHRLPKR